MTLRSPQIQLSRSLVRHFHDDRGCREILRRWDRTDLINLSPKASQFNRLQAMTALRFASQRSQPSTFASKIQTSSSVSGLCSLAIAGSSGVPARTLHYRSFVVASEAPAANAGATEGMATTPSTVADKPKKTTAKKKPSSTAKSARPISISPIELEKHKMARLIWDFGLDPEFESGTQPEYRIYYPESEFKLTSEEMKFLLEKHCVAHVHLTMNNTVITMTDSVMNPKTWTSSGSAGFAKAKRSQPVAASAAALLASQRMLAAGYRTCHVQYKGTGKSRDSVVRALRQGGLKITVIMDKTPIPHNGDRPRKQRRV